MNMSLSDLNALYRIAEQREKTKDGKSQHASEVLEDELMEAGI
jgi:hypothetical protein